MDFFSILTLLGGLALFLYGMQVMGDGLAKVSGGKLEQILENLTSSKWKAVLLGLCVTAVIQSSSATTVMVVGFVNSGIMKLTQAVGIIMGANIGTTVTSWLLNQSFEAEFLFTGAGNGRNYPSDLYQKFTQKGYWYDSSWICGINVWYGIHEWCCKAAGRCPGIYRTSS